MCYNWKQTSLNYIAQNYNDYLRHKIISIIYLRKKKHSQSIVMLQCNSMY